MGLFDGLAGLMQPQAQSPVPATPGSPEWQQNKQSWDRVLNSPNVTAGLMQFAVNMTQPLSHGQSPLGQFGQSVGAGIEASDRVTKMDEERQIEAERQAVDQERLRLQGEQINTQRQGQQLNADVNREQIAAQGSRLEREYQLKTVLEQLPPNQQSLVMETWSKLVANPPITKINDPAWSEEALQQAIDAVTQSAPMSGTVPGAPTAVTPGATLAPDTMGTTPPPIPDALKDKPGLQWSARTQRFKDANGVIYNLQGVVVP